MVLFRDNKNIRRLLYVQSSDVSLSCLKLSALIIDFFKGVYGSNQCLYRLIKACYITLSLVRAMALWSKCRLRKQKTLNVGTQWNSLSQRNPVASRLGAWGNSCNCPGYPAPALNLACGKILFLSDTPVGKLWKVVFYLGCKNSVLFCHYFTLFREQTA